MGTLFRLWMSQCVGIYVFVPLDYKPYRFIFIDRGIHKGIKFCRFKDFVMITSIVELVKS